MAQGKGRNSTDNLIKLISGDSLVEIPECITLTDEEIKLWPVFAQARAREDWREVDLVILARAVRLEVKARELERLLDESGPIVKNRKGTPVPNPLYGVIDGLVRQQLAILRTLNMHTGLGDPRTALAKNLTQLAYRRAVEADDGLIARPE